MASGEINSAYHCAAQRWAFRYANPSYCGQRRLAPKGAAGAIILTKTHVRLSELCCSSDLGSRRPPCGAQAGQADPEITQNMFLCFEIAPPARPFNVFCTSGTVKSTPSPSTTNTASLHKPPECTPQRRRWETWNAQVRPCSGETGAPEAAGRRAPQWGRRRRRTASPRSDTPQRRKTPGREGMRGKEERHNLERNTAESARHGRAEARDDNATAHEGATP